MGQHLLPPELFLVIPALQRKAERGEATANEMFGLSMLKDIMDAFSNTGALGATGEKEKGAGTGERPGRSAGASAAHLGPGGADVSSRTNSGGAEGLISPTRRTAEGLHPDPEEILSVIQELHEVYPELRDLRKLVEQSGMSASQKRVLWPSVTQNASRWEEPSVADCEKTAKLLDRTSWDLVKAAVARAIEERKATPVGEKICLPTYTSIFGSPPPGSTSTGANSPPKKKGNVQKCAPWREMALAFLGSPHIRLTGRQVIFANFAGFGDFVHLYTLAQNQRQELIRRSRPADFASQEASTIREASEGLDQQNVRTTVFPEGGFRDIPGVVEVLSATFGFNSVLFGEKEGGIGKTVGDVTALVQLQLASNGVLELENEKALGQLLRKEVGQAGLASGFRTSLNTLVAGQDGKRFLKVIYRSSEADPDPAIFLPRVEALTDYLRQMHKTEPHWAQRRDALGPFTWYKLSEWMQVEIVQIFGATMHHTPWFRFPFTQFMWVYFQVGRTFLVKQVHRNTWYRLLQQQGQNSLRRWKTLCFPPQF